MEGGRVSHSACIEARPSPGIRTFGDAAAQALKASQFHPAQALFEVKLTAQLPFKLLSLSPFIEISPSIPFPLLTAPSLTSCDFWQSHLPSNTSSSVFRPPPPPQSGSLPLCSS